MWQESVKLKIDKELFFCRRTAGKLTLRHKLTNMYYTSQHNTVNRIVFEKYTIKADRTYFGMLVL